MRIPRVRRTWFSILVILGVGISIGPYVWTLLTSLKTEDELFQVPVTYLPQVPTFENYVNVFAQNPFGRFILNSLIVCTVATTVVLVLGSLAGYAFGRLRFPGKGPLLLGVLAFSTLPVMSLIVPLYTIVQGLGWLNSYLGLIIPYVTWTLPLAVFILTNFFRQISKNLEESAWIDGATRLGALRHVIAPLSGPGLVSAATITFVNIWNDFLIGFTLVSQREMRTVTVGITMYQSEFAFPWGTITAAVSIATIPVAILLLFGQRWVTSGLTAGAIKG
ncbi:carbohydrate ABC transporter permease [Limnochorda pilosa]|uniref:Sugar ABC transporter permease n=1 Tax=Limnochorda pilosa TaxID=1555112 RepID=A0A0K2SGP3_LIMPI|nr:carbohydrate ABC transporter permease [Limnochorda pilosa]BAS26281.1 sugar ABC transporter permease [Limnochorda pilosa]